MKLPAALVTVLAATGALAAAANPPPYSKDPPAMTAPNEMTCAGEDPSLLQQCTDHAGPNCYCTGSSVRPVCVNANHRKASECRLRCDCPVHPGGAPPPYSEPSGGAPGGPISGNPNDKTPAVGGGRSGGHSKRKRTDELDLLERVLRSRAAAAAAAED